MLLLYSENMLLFYMIIFYSFRYIFVNATHLNYYIYHLFYYFIFGKRKSDANDYNMLLRDTSNFKFKCNFIFIAQLISITLSFLTLSYSFKIFIRFSLSFIFFFEKYCLFLKPVFRLLLSVPIDFY